MAEKFSEHVRDVYSATFIIHVYLSERFIKCNFFLGVPDYQGRSTLHETTSNDPDPEEYDDSDDTESVISAGNVDVPGSPLIFKQKTIFIRKLPWNMSEQRLFDELYHLFSNIGPIKVITSKNSPKTDIRLYYFMFRLISEQRNHVSIY